MSTVTKSRSSNGHPAVVFSPVRAKAWAEVATDEDFFRYYQGLREIYAKRHYKENSGKLTDEDKLHEDFKVWRDKQPVW